MSEDRSRLLDLSSNGARLRNERELEVGSVHDFTFELLGETVRVRAKVRHCLPEERNPGFQVGVEFVKVDPATSRRLEAFARKRRGRG
jgi:c-di-GMP-binding flagellar brake protein YcgR